MARPRSKTLADCHAAASRQGGRCLSKKYHGRAPLLWQCAKGHKFKKSPYRVFAGSWCKECWKTARRVYDIEYFRQRAAKKGGLCLSKKCGGVKDILEWQCKNGHTWHAMAESVKNGSWCRRCTTSAKWASCWKSRRIKIEFVRAQAQARGGQLLSNEIGNGSRDKLSWLCQYGHTWKMTYDSFSAGSWCPRCVGYVGELTTRVAMEGLFGVPFPRQRPIFLSVGARSRLELDGYNEDLKIAFEHHGLQHYQSIRHFTSQLKSVALRDRLKRKLCGRHGVKLIEVPQVGRMTPVHQLVPLIIAQAEKLGVQPHIVAPAFSLESSDAYKRLRNPFAVQAAALSSRHKRNRLEALRAVATHHRAKLLTREYFGSQGYYRFKCANGHKLVLSYRQIREGVWCNDCEFKAGPLTKTLAGLLGKREFVDEKERDVRAETIAKQNSGTFMGAQGKGAQRKFLFACKAHHRFYKLWKDIQKGQWCHQCAVRKARAKVRLGLAALKETAAKRGGKCLSKEYTTTGAKYLWECRKKHKWSATANHVRRGTWCPRCASEAHLR